MSAPQYAVTPAGFALAPPINFTVTNSTVAKVVVDAAAGALASGYAPSYYGGVTVIDCTVSSSDSASKDVLFYRGTVATTQGTTPTGAMASTVSTITRAVGDFFADGWRIGDLLMTFSAPGVAPNAAVDGIIAIVTTVATLTLTVSGAPFSALSLAAGTRIVRVRPLCRLSIPAGAGTSSGVPNVSLIGAGVDATLIREMKLGASDMLIAGMQAAVSALPAGVSMDAQVARY